MGIRLGVTMNALQVTSISQFEPQKIERSIATQIVFRTRVSVRMN
jgi:hypothetical protein